MSLFGGWRLTYEKGDGAVFYFGRHRGAPFITVGLHGFSGWTSTPRWMPGGWEFYSPWIGVGRLFEDRSRYLRGRFIIPAAIVRLWRKRKRAYRDAMREHPLPAVGAARSDLTPRGRNVGPDAS